MKPIKYKPKTIGSIKISKKLGNVIVSEQRLNEYNIRMLQFVLYINAINIDLEIINSPYRWNIKSQRQ